MSLLKKTYLYLLCIFAVSANAATNVILENSEELSFDKEHGRDYQILRGNVRFRHDDAVMYCDSAYFYDTNNSFDAFGNCRVVQDTMTMTSNSMYYDGNTRIIKVRGGAELHNGGMTLTTDWLDYYRDANYGYYADGGHLVDPQFDIVSKVGYYYPNSKVSFFKGNVTMVSGETKILTDSLKFDQKQNISSVFGPSTIYHTDYTIETTHAWTNTVDRYGRLYNHSVLTSKKGSKMTADSIHFSSLTNIVEMWGDALALDDSSHTGFSGDYAWMQNNPNSGLVVGKACMMDFSNPDDTMFVHGDTIKYHQSPVDTTKRELYAFHHVKLFSNDMQAKGDSMSYIELDSLIRLDGNPVLWSDESQITGDTIKIFTKNNKPNWMHIRGNAFVIQQQAIDCFDQLNGREAKGYFEKSYLDHLDMMGNATSVYYAQDDYNKLIGINKCEGQMLSIFLNNKKMDRIKMTPESKGTMYPPGRIPEKEKTLRGFNWREKERPLSKEDIFKWE
ncbi:MAG: hypothetical protein KBT22_04210 [Bacteroidales bacterium]|nr:hypothetical protein [Candidatus Scybalocola fimicaballi]